MITMPKNVSRKVGSIMIVTSIVVGCSGQARAPTTDQIVLRWSVWLFTDFPKELSQGYGLIPDRPI
jgi:hypothetical protein